jgi:hypothetical protein
MLRVRRTLEVGAQRSYPLVLLTWLSFAQLERKRHLGNDIVVIIFVDGTTPFSPSLLKSEFNRTPTTTLSNR